MLEKTVAQALSSVLGKYFEGISADQLRMNMLSGRINLRHLTVRDDALQCMGLPLQVVSGTVEEIDVSMPLGLPFRARGINATIRGLHIVCELSVPTPSASSHRRLEAGDVELTLRAMEQHSGMKETITKKFLRRLFDGFAINIHDVVLQIRIPHHTVATSASVVSVRLETFTLRQVESLHDTMAHILEGKHAELTGLSLSFYDLTNGTQPSASGALDESRNIVGPVTLSAHWVRGAAPDAGAYEVVLQPVVVTMTPSLVLLLKGVHRQWRLLRRFGQFRLLRPPTSISSCCSTEGRAAQAGAVVRSWWRYAIRCIVTLVHEHRSQHLVARGALLLQKEYASAYARTLSVVDGQRVDWASLDQWGESCSSIDDSLQVGLPRPPPLSSIHRSADGLMEMERRHRDTYFRVIPLVDLLALRFAARESIRRAHEHLVQTHMTETSSAASDDDEFLARDPSSSKGWFSGWRWGGGPKQRKRPQRILLPSMRVSAPSLQLILLGRDASKPLMTLAVSDTTLATATSSSQPCGIELFRCQAVQLLNAVDDEVIGTAPDVDAIVVEPARPKTAPQREETTAMLSVEVRLRPIRICLSHLRTIAVAYATPIGFAFRSLPETIAAVVPPKNTQALSLEGEAVATCPVPAAAAPTRSIFECSCHVPSIAFVFDETTDNAVQPPHGTASGAVRPQAQPSSVRAVCKFPQGLGVNVQWSAQTSLCRITALQAENVSVSVVEISSNNEEHRHVLLDPTTVNAFEKLDTLVGEVSSIHVRVNQNLVGLLLRAADQVKHSIATIRAQRQGMVALGTLVETVSGPHWIDLRTCSSPQQQRDLLPVPPLFKPVAESSLVFSGYFGDTPLWQWTYLAEGSDDSASREGCTVAVRRHAAVVSLPEAVHYGARRVVVPQLRGDAAALAVVVPQDGLCAHETQCFVLVVLRCKTPEYVKAVQRSMQLCFSSFEEHKRRPRTTSRDATSVRHREVEVQPQRWTLRQLRVSALMDPHSSGGGQRNDEAENDPKRLCAFAAVFELADVVAERSASGQRALQVQMCRLDVTQESGISSPSTRRFDVLRVCRLSDGKGFAMQLAPNDFKMFVPHIHCSLQPEMMRDVLSCAPALVQLMHEARTGRNGVAECDGLNAHIERYIRSSSWMFDEPLAQDDVRETHITPVQPVREPQNAVMQVDVTLAGATLCAHAPSEGISIGLQLERVFVGAMLPQLNTIASKIQLTTQSAKVFHQKSNVLSLLPQPSMSRPVALDILAERRRTCSRWGVTVSVGEANGRLLLSDVTTLATGMDRLLAPFLRDVLPSLSKSFLHRAVASAPAVVSNREAEGEDPDRLNETFALLRSDITSMSSNGNEARTALRELRKHRRQTAALLTLVPRDAPQRSDQNPLMPTHRRESLPWLESLDVSLEELSLALGDRSTVLQGQGVTDIGDDASVAVHCCGVRASLSRAPNLNGLKLAHAAMRILELHCLNGPAVAQQCGEGAAACRVADVSITKLECAHASVVREFILNVDCSVVGVLCSTALAIKALASHCKRLPHIGLLAPVADAPPGGKREEAREPLHTSRSSIGSIDAPLILVTSSSILPRPSSAATSPADKPDAKTTAEMETSVSFAVDRTVVNILGSAPSAARIALVCSGVLVTHRTLTVFEQGPGGEFAVAHMKRSTWCWERVASLRLQSRPFASLPAEDMMGINWPADHPGHHITGLVSLVTEVRSAPPPHDRPLSWHRSLDVSIPSQAIEGPALMTIPVSLVHGVLTDVRRVTACKDLLDALSEGRPQPPKPTPALYPTACHTAASIRIDAPILFAHGPHIVAARMGAASVTSTITRRSDGIEEAVDICVESASVHVGSGNEVLCAAEDNRCSLMSLTDLRLITSKGLSSDVMLHLHSVSCSVTAPMIVSAAALGRGVAGALPALRDFRGFMSNAAGCVLQLEVVHLDHAHQLCGSNGPLTADTFIVRPRTNAEDALLRVILSSPDGTVLEWKELVAPLVDVKCFYDADSCTAEVDGLDESTGTLVLRGAGAAELVTAINRGRESYSVGRQPARPQSPNILDAALWAPVSPIFERVPVPSHTTRKTVRVTLSGHLTATIGSGIQVVCGVRQGSPSATISLTRDNDLLDFCGNHLPEFEIKILPHAASDVAGDVSRCSSSLMPTVDASSPRGYDTVVWIPSMALVHHHRDVSDVYLEVVSECPTATDEERRVVVNVPSPDAIRAGWDVLTAWTMHLGSVLAVLGAEGGRGTTSLHHTAVIDDGAGVPPTRRISLRGALPAIHCTVPMSLVASAPYTCVLVLEVGAVTSPSDQSATGELCRCHSVRIHEYRPQQSTLFSMDQVTFVRRRADEHLNENADGSPAPRSLKVDFKTPASCRAVDARLQASALKHRQRRFPGGATLTAADLCSPSAVEDDNASESACGSDVSAASNLHGSFQSFTSQVLHHHSPDDVGGDSPRQPDVRSLMEVLVVADAMTVGSVQLSTLLHIGRAVFLYRQVYAACMDCVAPSPAATPSATPNPCSTPSCGRPPAASTARPYVRLRMDVGDTRVVLGSLRTTITDLCVRLQPPMQHGLFAGWKAATCSLVPNGPQTGNGPRRSFSCTLSTLQYKLNQEGDPTIGSSLQMMYHRVSAGKLELLTAPEHDAGALLEAVASIVSVCTSLKESLQPLSSQRPPPPIAHSVSHQHGVPPQHHAELRLHSLTSVVQPPDAYQSFGPMVLKSDPINAHVHMCKGQLVRLMVGEVVWTAQLQHQRLFRHATPELLRMVRTVPLDTTRSPSTGDLDELSSHGDATRPSPTVLDVDLRLGTLECTMPEALLVALEALLSVTFRDDNDADDEDAGRSSKSRSGGFALDSTFSGSLAGTMSLSDDTQVAVSPLASFLAAPPRVRWRVSCQQAAVYLGDDTLVSVSTEAIVVSPSGNVEEVSATCKGTLQLLPMARLQHKNGDDSTQWHETSPVAPIVWVEWHIDTSPTRTSATLGPITFETSTSFSREALQRPIRLLLSGHRRSMHNHTSITNLLLGQSIQVSQLTLYLEHSLVSPVQSHLSSVRVVLPSADCILQWKRPHPSVLALGLVVQIRLRGIEIRLSDENGLSAEAEWICLVADVLPNVVSPSAGSHNAASESHLSRSRTVGALAASATTAAIGSRDSRERRDRRLGWFIRNVRRVLAPEDSTDESTRRLVDNLLRGRGSSKRPPMHHIDASDIYVAIRLKRKVHLHVRTTQVGVLAPTVVDEKDPFEKYFSGVVLTFVLDGVYSLGDQSLGCGGVQLHVARTIDDDKSSLCNLRTSMRNNVDPGGPLHQWPTESATLLRLHLQKVSFLRTSCQLMVEGASLSGDIGAALSICYAIVCHTDGRTRAAKRGTERRFGTPRERFVHLCRCIIQERRAKANPRSTRHMGNLLGEAVDRWTANQSMCAGNSREALINEAEELLDSVEPDTSEFSILAHEHYLLGYIWFLPKQTLESELRALAERQTARQRATRIGPLEVQIVPLGTSYAFYRAQRTADESADCHGVDAADDALVAEEDAIVIPSYFEVTRSMSAVHCARGSSDVNLWSVRCPRVTLDATIGAADLFVEAHDVACARSRSLTVSSADAPERRERTTATVRRVTVQDRSPMSCFPVVLSIGAEGEATSHALNVTLSSCAKSVRRQSRLTDTPAAAPATRSTSVKVGKCMLVHNAQFLRDLFSGWNNAQLLRPSRWSLHSGRRPSSLLSHPPTPNTMQLSLSEVSVVCPREVRDALRTHALRLSVERVAVNIRRSAESALLGPDTADSTEGVGYLLVDVQLQAPTIEVLTVLDGDVRSEGNTVLFEVASGETINVHVRNQQTHRVMNTGGAPLVSVRVDGCEADLTARGTMEGLALLLELSGRWLRDLSAQPVWNDYGPSTPPCCRGGCTSTSPCQRCFHISGVWMTCAPLWLDGLSSTDTLPQTTRGNVPNVWTQNASPVMVPGEVHYDEFDTWLWAHALRCSPHASPEDPSGAVDYYVEVSDGVQVVREVRSSHPHLYGYVQTAMSKHQEQSTHLERLSDRIVCIFVPLDSRAPKVQRRSARVNLDGAASRPIAGRVGYAALMVCPSSALAAKLAEDINRVIARVRANNVVPVPMQSPREVWWTDQSYAFRSLTLQLIDEEMVRLACAGSGQGGCREVVHRVSVRCSLHNAAYTQRCRTPDWHLGLHADEGSLTVALLHKMEATQAADSSPCLSLTFGQSTLPPAVEQRRSPFSYTATLIHNRESLVPMVAVGLRGEFPAMKHHALVMPLDTTCVMTEGLVAHSALVGRFWQRFMAAYWDAQSCFKPALFRCTPHPADAPFQLVTWTVRAPDISVVVHDRNLRRDALHTRCRGLTLRWEMDGRGATHLTAECSDLHVRCPRERKALLCTPPRRTPTEPEDIDACSASQTGDDHGAQSLISFSRTVELQPLSASPSARQRLNVRVKLRLPIIAVRLPPAHVVCDVLLVLGGRKVLPVEVTDGVEYPVRILTAPPDIHSSGLFSRAQRGGDFWAWQQRMYGAVSASAPDAPPQMDSQDFLVGNVSIFVPEAGSSNTGLSLDASALSFRHDSLTGTTDGRMDHVRLRTKGKTGAASSSSSSCSSLSDDDCNCQTDAAHPFDDTADVPLVHTMRHASLRDDEAHSPEVVTPAGGTPASWPLYVARVQVSHKASSEARAGDSITCTTRPLESTLTESDVALLTNAWRSHSKWLSPPAAAPQSQPPTTPTNTSDGAVQPCSLVGRVEIDRIEVHLLLKGTPFLVATIEGRSAAHTPIVLEAHRDGNGSSAYAVPSIHIRCRDPSRAHRAGAIMDVSHAANINEPPAFLLRQQLRMSNAMEGVGQERPAGSGSINVLRAELSSIRLYVDPGTIRSCLAFSSARRLSATCSNLRVLRRQSQGPLLRVDPGAFETKTEAEDLGGPPLCGDWHVHMSSISLKADLHLSNRRRLIIHYPSSSHTVDGGERQRARVELNGNGHNVFLTHDEEEDGVVTADNTRWNVIVEGDVQLVLRDLTIVCTSDVPLRSLWYCSMGAAVDALATNGCEVQYASRADDDGELYLVAMNQGTAAEDGVDNLLADLTEENVHFGDRPIDFGAASDEEGAGIGAAGSDDQSIPMSDDWGSTAFGSSADFISDTGSDGPASIGLASSRVRPSVDLDVQVALRHVSITASTDHDAGTTRSCVSLAWDSMTARFVSASLRIVTQQWKMSMDHLRMHSAAASCSNDSPRSPLLTVTKLFVAHRWVLDQSRALSLRDIRRERAVAELGTVHTTLHANEIYSIYRVVSGFKDACRPDTQQNVRRAGSGVLRPPTQVVNQPQPTAAAPRVLKVRLDAEHIHVELWQPHRTESTYRISPSSDRSPFEEAQPVLSLRVFEASVAGRIVLPSLAHMLHGSLATSASVFNTTGGDWEPLLEVTGFAFDVDGSKRSGVLCHRVFAEAVNMMQLNGSKHMMTALLRYAEHMREAFNPQWTRDALLCSSAVSSPAASAVPFGDLEDDRPFMSSANAPHDDEDQSDPFVFSQPETPRAESDAFSLSATTHRRREDPQRGVPYLFRNETGLTILLFESVGRADRLDSASFAHVSKSHGQQWSTRAALPPGFEGVLVLDERCQPFALRFELQLCDPFSLHLSAAHTSYVPFTSQHAAVVDVTLQQQRTDVIHAPAVPLPSATVVGVVHIHSSISFVNRSYLPALDVQCFGMPPSAAHEGGTWSAVVSSRLQEEDVCTRVEDAASASPPMGWLTAQYQNSGGSQEKRNAVGWSVSCLKHVSPSLTVRYTSELLDSVLIFDRPTNSNRACFPVRLDRCEDADRVLDTPLPPSMFVLCTVHCIAATRGTMRGHIGQRYVTFATPTVFVNTVPVAMRLLLAADQDGRSVLTRRSVAAGGQLAVHTAILHDVDENVKGSGTAGGAEQIYVGAALISQQGWFLRQGPSLVRLVRHTSEPLRLRLRDARNPKHRTHVLVDVAWHSTLTHRGRAVATTLICTMYSPFVLFNNVGPTLLVLHEGHHVAGYPPDWVTSDHHPAHVDQPGDSLVTEPPPTPAPTATPSSAAVAILVVHDFHLVAAAALSPLDVCVACGHFILTELECRSRPEHHGVEQCRRCLGHCHPACSPAVRFASCLQRHELLLTNGRHHRSDRRIVLFTPSSRWSPFKATIQLALLADTRQRPLLSSDGQTPGTCASIDESRSTHGPRHTSVPTSATAIKYSAPIEIGAVEADGCVVVRGSADTRLVAVRSSVGPGAFVRSKLMTFSAFCVLRNLTANLTLEVWWCPSPSSEDARGAEHVALTRIAPGEEEEVILPHIKDDDVASLLPLQLSLRVHSSRDPATRDAGYVGHRSLPWTVTDVGRTMLKLYDVGHEFDEVHSDDWNEHQTTLGHHITSKEPATSSTSRHSPLMITAQSLRVGASVLVSLTESSSECSPLRVVNQTWMNVHVTQHVRQPRRTPADCCHVGPFHSVGFVYDDHAVVPLEVQVILGDGMCVVLDPLRCTGTRKSSDVLQSGDTDAMLPSAMRRSRRGAVAGRAEAGALVFEEWTPETPAYLVRNAGSGRFTITMEVGRHAMLLVVSERQPRCLLSIRNISWTLPRVADAAESADLMTPSTPSSKRLRLRGVVQRLVSRTKQQQSEIVSDLLPRCSDTYRMIITASRPSAEAGFSAAPLSSDPSKVSAVLYSSSNNGGEGENADRVHFDGLVELDLPVARNVTSAPSQQPGSPRASGLHALDAPLSDVCLSVTIQRKTLLEYVTVYRGSQLVAGADPDVGTFRIEPARRDNSSSDMGSSWLFVTNDTRLPLGEQAVAQTPTEPDQSGDVPAMRDVSMSVSWTPPPGTSYAPELLPTATVGLSYYLDKPSLLPDDQRRGQWASSPPAKRSRRVRVSSVDADAIAAEIQRSNGPPTADDTTNEPPSVQAPVLLRQRLSLNMRLSLGVSLIGTLPGGSQVEECYASLTDLSVQVSKRRGTLGELDVECTLGRLQIDHQRQEAFFPVVLSTPEIMDETKQTSAVPQSSPPPSVTPRSPNAMSPQDDFRADTEAETELPATPTAQSSLAVGREPLTMSTSTTVKTLKRHNSRKAVNRSVSFGTKRVDNFLHLSIAGLGGGGTSAITRVAYAGVCLQELMLTIDDGFVASVASIFPDSFSTLTPERGRSLTSLALQSLALPPPPREFRVGDAGGATSGVPTQELMHVQHLQLHPLLVDFTFFSSPENRALQESPALAILRTVGVIDVDRAPMRLNALLMENTFGPRVDIIAAVREHFVGQAIRSFYRLLGAINVLGNPINLLRGVGGGIADMFYEPAKGLVKSPAEFAAGLGRGMKKFASKTIWGTATSVKGVLSSVANGLAKASFDGHWQRDRRKALRKPIRHAGDGLRNAARHVGSGFLEGITGLFTQPYDGAQRGGALGLVKGIGKGIAGLAVKPVAGVLDGLSTAADVVGRSVVDEYPRLRARPPRVVNPLSNILQSYDYVAAECSELLYETFPMSTRRLLNDLVAHHPPSTSLTTSLDAQLQERLVTYVLSVNDRSLRYLLTTHRVVGVRTEPTPRLLWEVELERILRVTEVCSGDRRSRNRRQSMHTPPPTEQATSTSVMYEQSTERLHAMPDITTSALSLLVWFDAGGSSEDSVAMLLGPVEDEREPSWCSDDDEANHEARERTVRLAIDFINQLCALCPQDIHVESLDVLKSCGMNALGSSALSTVVRSRGGLLRRLQDDEAQRLGRAQRRREELGRHFCVACCQGALCCCPHDVAVSNARGGEQAPHAPF